MDAMVAAMQRIQGNPSSIHPMGQQAREFLNHCRQSILNHLNTPEGSQLVFTSGGTEANNLAIQGVCRAYFHSFPKSALKHVITSRIEHSAVLEPCRAVVQSKGWELSELPVNSEGRVSLDALKAEIRERETVLVSIMAANNEVGTLQDIQAIGTLCREHNILFHCDAVQLLGKASIDLSQLPVDLMSFSAHKIYGPKGIGALYIHPAVLQNRLIFPIGWGGAHEQGLRPGTENLPGIAGFAKAVELSTKRLPQTLEYIQTLQHYLQQRLYALETELAQHNHALKLYMLGPAQPEHRLPGIVSIGVSSRDPHATFKQRNGEAWVLQLGLSGVAVSSGSACHSESLNPSHVVLAMGYSPKVAQSMIRFSLGRNNTREEIDTAVETLKRFIMPIKSAPSPKVAATFQAEGF